MQNIYPIKDTFVQCCQTYYYLGAMLHVHMCIIYSTASIAIHTIYCSVHQIICILIIWSMYVYIQNWQFDKYALSQINLHI